MTEEASSIERLRPPLGDADLRSLARLLVDTLESGSAVSFLVPLALEQAEDWWRRTTAAAGAGAIHRVARDAEGIVGTVQLLPARAQTQRHRAEIVKLMIDRRARRRGLRTRLMHAIEDAARHAGFGLLTLDTKRGDEGERLYRWLGWTVAGTIPGYALDNDGAALHDTVIFYKQLSQS